MKPEQKKLGWYEEVNREVFDKLRDDYKYSSEKNKEIILNYHRDDFKIDANFREIFRIAINEELRLASDEQKQKWDMNIEPDFIRGTSYLRRLPGEKVPGSFIADNHRKS